MYMLLSGIGKELECLPPDEAGSFSEVSMLFCSNDKAMFVIANFVYPSKLNNTSIDLLGVHHKAQHNIYIRLKKNIATWKVNFLDVNFNDIKLDQKSFIILHLK
jgi:hypothetical protein